VKHSIHSIPSILLNTLSKLYYGLVYLGFVYFYRILMYLRGLKETFSNTKKSLMITEPSLDKIIPRYLHKSSHLYLD
jgi:hypothetical protein